MEGVGRDSTLIVFDWDDTVLPTSWLERSNALSSVGALRPTMRDQMIGLTKVASETLRLAATL